MIIEVPTHEDFAEHAYFFLNMAWDSVMRIGEILQDSKNPENEIDEETTDAIWKASKKPLLVAQALSQQGAEIALKAKIAAVSPYLLLTNNSSTWQRESKNRHTVFADFRTLDAQDLPKAHDLICESPLSLDFCKLFYRYRIERNSTFHSVDQRLSTSVHDVIVYILSISKILGQTNWLVKRSHYLYGEPSTVAFGDKFLHDNLLIEAKLISEILDQEEMVLYLGYDKSRPSYICPNCFINCADAFAEDIILSAQFEGDAETATILHCFVCDERVSVVRKKCKNTECEGEITWIDDVFGEREVCLTCFNR